MSNRAFTRWADSGQLTPTQGDTNLDGIYRPYATQNFLVNPTGLLANLGWNSSSFGSTKSPTIGWLFRNASAVSAATYDESIDIPTQASVNWNISGTSTFTTSQFTLGQAFVAIVAYDSSGNSLGEVARFSFSHSSSGFASATGITPANTATIRVRKGVENGSDTGVAVSANGLGFCNLKLEFGTNYSPFSDEATTLMLSPTPPAKLSPVFQAVTAASGSFTSSLNGFVNPNLQFNGSGEFGSNGWGLPSNISATVDTVGGIGAFLTNPNALSNASFQAFAPNIPIGPSKVLTYSARVNTAGVSAGSLRLQLTAYNSSGTYISDIAGLAVPIGTAEATYTLTGTTPANTAYVRWNVFVITGLTAVAYGIIWRRVKVELGSVATLFSQEASISDAVTLDGAQTITGAKNFSNWLTASGGSNSFITADVYSNGANPSASPRVSLRNDGTYGYLIGNSSASAAPGTYDAYRPFTWNLATGNVAIAQNGSNVGIGYPNSGLTTILNQTLFGQSSGSVGQATGASLWPGTTVNYQGGWYNQTQSDVNMYLSKAAGYTVSSLMNFMYNGAAAGSITLASASTVAYNTSSDYRIKVTVGPLTGALDDITSVPVYEGYYKCDGAAGMRAIMLAHEIAVKFPYAVTGEKDAVEYTPVYKDGYDPNNITEDDIESVEETPVLQQVDYSKLVPSIVSALNDAKALIADLRERISILEAK